MVEEEDASPAGSPDAVGIRTQTSVMEIYADQARSSVAPKTPQPTSRA